MYVIFEGIDTAGKSTQIELFEKNIKDVTITREPGGTKLGEKLREIILKSEHKIAFNTELFLFLADRAQNFEENIQNSRDKILISDRGMISGISYALANHPMIDAELLILMNKFALSGHLPDKVVLFKTNKELIQRRLYQKKHDNIESRGIDYLLKVQDLMIDVLNKLPIKVLIIDASKSIEEIHKEIKEFIL
ncbi:MAG: dTMP kinase [Epsilonproteobacteria bacterium]|nr:dTMP kinase [Campylobacterota bacterium]